MYIIIIVAVCYRYTRPVCTCTVNYNNSNSDWCQACGCWEVPLYRVFVVLPGASITFILFTVVAICAITSLVESDGLMHPYIVGASRFGGMEWWNGTVEWNSGMVEYWNGGVTSSLSMHRMLTVQLELKTSSKRFRKDMG